MSTPSSDQHLGRPTTATSLPVIVLRLAAVAALPVGLLLYFYVDGDAAAPDTFFPRSWTLMLLPPTVVVIPLVLGFWRRVPDPSRRRVYLSRASTAIGAIGLVLASSFSLLYFAGELFDYLLP